MAKAIVPKLVVRLHPDKNPHTTWGYKWHLVKRPNRKKVIQVSHTHCDMLLRSGQDVWESSRLSIVKKKDLCARCFSALIVED